MIEWMQAHPATITGLVLWLAGILWLLPGAKPSVPRPALPGMLMSAAGVVAFCWSTGAARGEFADDVMFWVFAFSALFCGVLMITSGNPVYAALWFALTTLATCGLFLLQSAPFLAAATIIVYAGAVIVTFLFVIMLAQQSGAAGYDRAANQPIMASVMAFVLLGAITLTLQGGVPDLPRVESVKPVAVAVPVEDTDQILTPSPAGVTREDLDQRPEQPGNLLSRADERHAVGSLKGLGRSLFGDYLFAVEIAGTLLLVASIGAIAVAPRREQGAL